MTKAWKLSVGALALSTLAIAAPKSYNVVLDSPMRAGKVDLAPGEYKVKVEGSNAVFTGAHTRQSVMVPVKVENTNTKYEATALDTTKQGSTELLTSIELGGSKTKLEFGQ